MVVKKGEEYILPMQKQNPCLQVLLLVLDVCYLLNKFQFLRYNIWMKSLKIFGVVLAALIVTTLSIDATDSLGGKSGTLLGQLISFDTNVCDEGMVHFPATLTFSCVDKYEVSATDDCLVRDPNNQFDTETNLSERKCLAESNAKKSPWRFINREQAEVMCTRSGKRLPSAAEWYKFSLGTQTEDCNINTNRIATENENPECLSAGGVFNTVGNAWEWVSDDVISGVYEGRKLPGNGYVAQVDSFGMAIVLQNEKLDKGYFWSTDEGAYGMLRGGFYGSRDDASVYTVHAETAPDFSGAAVGFRCVR